MLESLVWILVVHDLRQRIFYLGGVFEVWFLGESFHEVVDFGGLTIMVHHVRWNYSYGDMSGSDFINMDFMI